MPIVVTMVVAYIAIAGSALNIVDVEAKPNGLEQSSTRTASVSDSMDATVDVARYRRLQQISDEASTTPQDDSIDGRRKKSKCKPIGGSVPSGNYAGHDIDDDDEDKMEDFYDQARRYCDDVRPLCNIMPATNRFYGDSPDNRSIIFFICVLMSPICFPDSHSYTGRLYHEPPPLLRIMHAQDLQQIQWQGSELRNFW